MIKSSFITIVLIFCFVWASAQACLPEGISFTTQGQIDNFQNNYPNCTEIEGDVDIGDWYGPSDITNLSGLNVVNIIGGSLTIRVTQLTNLTGLDKVTSIGGSLNIENAQTLTSLAGLEGVNFIEGDLRIYDNVTLTSLTGLDNLASIVGNLEIWHCINMTSLLELGSVTFIGGHLLVIGCDDLINLNGLDNITSIDGGVIIDYNDALTSLAGLDNVTSLGGALSIWDNDALTSLVALDNVTSVGGGLFIVKNDVLTSLAGLDNIDEGSIIDLGIHNNSSLGTCDASWLCNYLAEPNGSISIYNNASGCDSPLEIADNCGVTISCLPYGHYCFASQLHVDEFSNDYPTCFELEGDVQILENNDITNLIGLSQVISIADDLVIRDNGSLDDVAGLNNLTTIGGELMIWDNNSLTTISGMNGLTSIGDGLIISSNDNLISLAGLNNLTTIGDDLQFGNNDALPNMAGLEGLTSIGGMIWINGNDALTSLAGLDNISSSTIEEIRIGANYSLSDCEVQSVCSYLVNSIGPVFIGYNTIGCNSPEEVLDSCEAAGLNIYEQNIEDNLILYPNPANQVLYISAGEYIIKEVTIFTQTGQQAMRQRPEENSVDVSKLHQGMYIVEVMVENTRFRKKLLIQR